MKNNESETMKHLKEAVQALYRISAELNLVDHPDPPEEARIQELRRVAAINALRADNYIRDLERGF